MIRRGNCGSPSCVTHSPWLPYSFLKQLRRLPQVAVPCTSLRGPRINFPRKGVNILRESCRCLALFSYSPWSPLPLKILALGSALGWELLTQRIAGVTLFFSSSFFVHSAVFYEKLPPPPHLRPVGEKEDICRDLAKDQAVSLATIHNV